MQIKKNKKIGVLIMVLGLLVTVFLYFYFNLWGAKIEYRNLPFVLKVLLADFFLPVGLYFGLYFSHSKKLALQIGGGLTVLLIVGYLVGLLIH